jgi:hypothetical protein
MEEPKCLVTAVILITFSACFQGRRVVASNFFVSETLGPCTDYLGVAIELDGDKTARVVWPHWTHANEGLHLLNLTYTNLIVH